MINSINPFFYKSYIVKKTKTNRLQSHWKFCFYTTIGTFQAWQSNVLKHKKRHFLIKDHIFNIEVYTQYIMALNQCNF